MKTGLTFCSNDDTYMHLGIRLVRSDGSITCTPIDGASGRSPGTRGLSCFRSLVHLYDRCPRHRGIRAGPSDRSASLSVFERLPTGTEEQVSRAAKAAASRAGENSWENELENATSGINLGCAK
jgi:hypothetical protein